jgi:hypothetical protein
MGAVIAHPAQGPAESGGFKTLFAAIAALVLVLLTAATAHAAAPLPGSAFQGDDGNQADEGGVDWQAFQGLRRVVHAPNTDRLVIHGNEKTPGNWEIEQGAGDVEIADAWSAIEQVGGQTFLYLAFARSKTTGSTHVAFELNQDSRLWDNRRSDRPIPCRRNGDVRVTFDYQGNKFQGAKLQRWRTDAPEGETTDPQTGCAKAGSFEAQPTTPVGSAQGAVNQVAIANYLGGTYDGKTIPPNGFGEAALNLSTLLGATPFDTPCFNFGSIWMYRRASTSPDSALHDYVAPRPLAARRCTASGTKFLDLDADGSLDAAEPGLPRFIVWADFNNDGTRNTSEPFTTTDDDGHYILADIRPPGGGTYTLRETVYRSLARSGWVCSHPHAEILGGGSFPGGLFACGWGPIDPAQDPDSGGRNFGNWLPALLTVKKKLWPNDDPSRFDLQVGGRTVVTGGHGAQKTIALTPGSYGLREAAIAPADPADFRSTVACRSTTARRSRVRDGTEYPAVVLSAKQRATCTFTNVRVRTPAIAIEKTGPESATAGDRLRFRLYVTTPGDVPLAAGTVRVADPTCDRRPVLVAKTRDGGRDPSPGSLDPGDTWIYRCSKTTAATAGECVAAVLTNTATATASAGGIAVRDTDSIDTMVNCPTEPIEPSIPPPGLERPDPPIDPEHPAPGITEPAPGTLEPSPGYVASIAPPGPPPPSAEQLGRAGLQVPSGCVGGSRQVRVVGTRMARITTTVDGRAAGRRTVPLLQRSVPPLTRLPAPGRRRLSVRVVFELGSGAPAVTLARTIVICPPPRPRLTG